MKKAWELERELRINAIPMDRRIHGSGWFDLGVLIQANDMLLKMFWEEHVPGSGAVEHAYMEMIQAQENKGYDLSKAVPFYEKGMRLLRSDDLAGLRAVTTEMLEAIFSAPKIKDHPYFQYFHPETWDSVVEEMGEVDHENKTGSISDLAQKIHQGWVGQLAGASFGTAIEGYTGENIAKVYGEVTSYITDPETMNDDVVYELILLDVFEQKGRYFTSKDLGLEWVKQLSFAWSAEWIAFQNIKQGYLPPVSGSHRNPYSNWIGAQMRGMICGMLAPGWALEAARLAHVDGVVSHSANGVYGEIFAAVLTSLAFIEKDPRKLILSAAEYIPARSEYKDYLNFVLKTAKQESDPIKAWHVCDEFLKRYNWIHAYPNMAADVLALWFGEGDMTKTLSILAKAGMDVDCNGGLVGNILGITGGVPAKWADPIGDLLETYLPGKERLSIKKLADSTTELSERSD
ncbi:MAG: ADP-ribosylglycohydrolase family protein [Pelolinea sp.]|nr:ADP-ribosylglycohydrolase family protein [Pelolinea sp.]